MKNLLISFALMISLNGFGQRTVSPVVRAGISEINITPEKPVVMSGYGNRDQPFKGVHDSLYAQALYLTGAREEALIITADLIGFSHENIKILKDRIHSKTSIPEDNIIITASHNHGGPNNGTYSENPPVGVVDYVTSLHKKLVQVSMEARQSIFPVKIGYEKGTCMMNINRRAIYGDGEIWLGRNLEGVCDHDLDIIKISDADDHLKAVFLNYPCHGTCTGQDNLLITGDWPGISAKMLKEKLNDEVIVMVTAGASADINPIYGPNNNYRQVKAVAYGIASVAHELVKDCSVSEVTELATAYSVSGFPGKKRWDSNLPQASVPDGEVDITYSGIRIGNLMLLGISGELFTEIGMEVKSRYAENTIILTHCNGASGYICTDRSYESGGYEPQVSRLMPGEENGILEGFENLVEQLSGNPQASFPSK